MRLSEMQQEEFSKDLAAPLLIFLAVQLASPQKWGKEGVWGEPIQKMEPP